MRPNVVTRIGVSVAMLVIAQVHAAEYNPARTRPGAQAEAERPAQRVIVKLRMSSDATRLQTQASPSGESGAAAAKAAGSVASTAMIHRMQALAGRVRVTLESTRGIGPNLQVMHVSPLARGEAAADMLARLRADPEVEYAVPDRRVYAHATSNDPLATGQWYLGAAEKSAINADGAWDITTGGNGVVIAVIDTGVRFDHPDLKAANQGGRLLPGHDFVSADPEGGFKTANDGNARDADASDPGDWVATADNCDGPVTPSSWHGTRVSGIIGALTNNAVGVAGITWSGWILPVRVIGKCGGFNSDVLAGMRWAAGLHIEGVPDNTHPANVLNISLGGEGPCDSASADVTSELASRGVLIVVSAGNEGGPVDSPANCPGAMGIAGLRHAGTKVGFSSLGPEIKLGAPAGNCVNDDGMPCEFSIDTTTNTGDTTPASNSYTDKTTANRNIGTSFSSPIVSGIAGLMLAVNGNLKSTQLIARLQEGATRPFPTTSDTGTPPVCHLPAGPADIQGAECSCTTSTCGAGMANARGSVDAALRPIAAIAKPSGITAGMNVTLQGGSSAAACNHTIASYAWTIVNASGTPPVIQGANTATAVVQAPVSGATTVRLTVTDDAGRQDTADILLSPSSATSTAPANAGSTACLAPITVPQLLPQVTVAATDANAAETGDTGTFTFRRTGDLSAALSATIAVAGTATNGVDFQSIGTSVTFSAGVATSTVTVTPIDNMIVGGSKSIIVMLQSGSGYTVGTASTATVTIADNDTAPAPPPASGGGGGGGGGAVDWFTLLASLAAVSLAAMARTSRWRAAYASGRHAPAPSTRRR